MSRVLEHLPRTLVGLLPGTLSVLSLGRGVAPTCLARSTSIQCGSPGEAFLSLPLGREDIALWLQLLKLSSASFGGQLLDIICSSKIVPQTSFTSLGLSTNFPSHAKFLTPSEGVGGGRSVPLSQVQADRANFLPSNQSPWQHENDLCSSLLRPWDGILKEASGCHSFQGGL